MYCWDWANRVRSVDFDLCLFKSKLVMQILQDMRTITAGKSLKLLTDVFMESNHYH